MKKKLFPWTYQGPRVGSLVRLDTVNRRMGVVVSRRGLGKHDDGWMYVVYDAMGTRWVVQSFEMSMVIP